MDVHSTECATIYNLLLGIHAKCLTIESTTILINTNEIHSLLLQIPIATFDYNFKLREFCFAPSNAIIFNYYKKIPLEKVDINESQISLMKQVLFRNRSGWQKCIDATVVLLGLKKNKLYSHYRNVLSIVISMIWNTKETKVWTE